MRVMVIGGVEFGADLVFNLPARFLAESSLHDEACASFSDLTLSIVSQDLQRFPRIQMNVRLQKKDSDSKNKPSTLEIKLEKTSKRSSRALAPRFPTKVKDEAWWLVLGDTSTSLSSFLCYKKSFFHWSFDHTHGVLTSQHNLSPEHETHLSIGLLFGV